MKLSEAVEPIKSEEDYQRVMQEIEALWDSAPGTPEIKRLEALAVLVEAYENEHFPI